jgi:elongation factor G
MANARTGKAVRVANLFSVRGKDLQNTDELVAGDIGVITKLDDVQTGDTHVRPRPGFDRDAAKLSAPALLGRGDARGPGRQRQDGAVADQRVRRRPDPALPDHLRHQADGAPGHGRTSCRCGRTSHGAEVWHQRRDRRAEGPYQETITKIASAQYRHKKQTGGAGQFAEVHLRVEPKPPAGYEFTSEVFGGAISSSFYPSIEKGIKSVLENGVIAGYPVVDVKAIVFDGKEHPVDSKDIAFQTAGREVFKLAFKAANPVLLEPIYIVEVTVPDEYMGDVMSDFNTRRGRVLGMEQKGNRTVVRATVPLAEIMRYSTDLRSMTQGAASTPSSSTATSRCPATPPPTSSPSTRKTSQKQGGKELLSTLFSFGA